MAALIANQRISEHVLYSEVRCRCRVSSLRKVEACDGGHVRQEALALFETIRAECSRVLGKDCPIKINSGVRCEFHNIMIGGKDGSQHLIGKALDLATPPGINVSLFHAIADDLNPDGGVGYYDWGVHVDVRGERARWGSKGVELR